MQNTQGSMNPWFYQSVMTVETVGLFKTAERNPEKRPECETHSPRPFTKKSSDNSLWQKKLVHSVRITLEQNPEFNI